MCERVPPLEACAASAGGLLNRSATRTRALSRCGGQARGARGARLERGNPLAHRLTTQRQSQRAYPRWRARPPLWACWASASLYWSNGRADGEGSRTRPNWATPPNSAGARGPGACAGVAHGPGGGRWRSINSGALSQRLLKRGPGVSVAFFEIGWTHLTSIRNTVWENLFGLRKRSDSPLWGVRTPQLGQPLFIRAAAARAG